MVIFENVTLETSIDRPKPAKVGDNAALVLKMMSRVLAVVENSRPRWVDPARVVSR